MWLLGSAATFATAGESVQFADSVRQNPPEHIFVTKIDLADPRVGIVIAPGGPDPDGPGPWETALRTPSDIARTLDLAVAVNGGFFAHQMRDGDPHHYFAGEPARAANLVMIDGQIATAAHDGAALVFDAQNHASIGTINKEVPASARQIIAGGDQIVLRGQNVGVDQDRAPRTSAGLADGGKTLVLLVVDGRRPETSAGMTLKELAAAMIALGCTDAINLDGGGSSAMVRKNADGRFKVVNTPSDGSTLFLPLSVERPVAYTFGVRIAAR